MDVLSEYVVPYAKKLGVDRDVVNDYLNLCVDIVERTNLYEKAREFDREGPKLVNGWAQLPTGNEKIYHEFAKASLYATFVPERYGGHELPTLLYNAFIEIVARACASTALGSAVQGSVMDIILMFGNEEQKEKYLPDLAAGKKWGSVCFTEPGAGSDLASAQTRAEYEDGYYILNGQKQWITNGGFSDIYIVYAKTDPELGKKGFSQFIVEKGMEGFSVGRLEKKYGLEASPTAVLNFDDCKVPEENLLGKRGEGLKQTIMGLSGGERIGVAAWATGISWAAYLEAKEYSQERKAFGKKIAEFPIIKKKLEMMEHQLDISRQLYTKAAYIKDSNGPFTIEASIAKLYATEAGIKITYENQQIHGGNGISREFNAERHVRDIRTGTIGGGTSEIQQMIITRHFKNENVKYKGDKGPYELWHHPQLNHTYEVPKGLIDWEFYGVSK